MQFLVFVFLSAATTARAAEIFPIHYTPQDYNYVNALLDLTSHPELMNEVRAQIQTWLEIHPYFQTTSAAIFDELLTSPEASSLEKFLGLSYDDVSVLGFESRRFKLAAQLNGLCQKARAWQQLEMSGDCARDLATVVCSVGQMMNTSIGLDTSRTLADYSWMLKWFDSFGKVPAGFLTGNAKWLGSYEECVLTDIVHDGRHIKGKYGLLNIQPTAFKYANRTLTISIGLCLPSQCSKDDLAVLSNYVDQITLLEPIVVKNQQLSSAEPASIDAVFIATCAFMLFIFLLLLFATFYDTFIHRTKLQQLIDNNEKSEIDQEIDNEMIRENYNLESPICVKILLCFSIYTNVESVLSTTRHASDISCVHGIRFFTICWVMLGHAYYFGVNFVANPTIVANYTSSSIFMVINNSTFSIDTFFCLAGFLIAYKFFAIDNPMTLLDWLRYYAHRFLRLTPVYALVIALAWSLWDQLGTGPMYQHRVDNGLIAPCATKWWHNLLYVNNLIDPFDDQCLAWTWFLGALMQLFILTPPLLVLCVLTTRGNQSISIAGITTICIFIVISCTYRLAIIWLHELPYAAISRGGFESQNTGEQYADRVFQCPLSRSAPYLVGLLFGMIQGTSKSRLASAGGKMSSLTLWCVIFVIQWMVLFLPYTYSLTGYWSTATGLLYAAFSRCIWGLTIACMVYLCAQGRGGPINKLLSAAMFIPLSRLVYPAYLIHPLVTFYYYSTLTQLNWLSHLNTMYVFSATLILSYIIALLLSVCIERPVLNLSYLLLRPNRCQSTDCRELKVVSANRESKALI